MLYDHHQNSISEYFHPQKILLVPICSTHLQPQVFTNLLLSLDIICPKAWTYHINGIIKYVAFLSGFTYNAFEIHSCCSITTSFIAK